MSLNLDELKTVAGDVVAKAEAAFKDVDSVQADIDQVVADLRTVANRLEAVSPTAAADVTKVANVTAEVSKAAGSVFATGTPATAIHAVPPAEPKV